MRYGLDISPVGSTGDPRTMAELARMAEDSGWDGVFVEDYVFYHDESLPAYDPWVTLAAVATATARITLGTLVTPLARRRVWKLAAEAVAVDHLSGGRLVLGRVSQLVPGSRRPASRPAALSSVGIEHRYASLLRLAGSGAAAPLA